MNSEIKSAAARFWPKVVRKRGCWAWRASKTDFGYGFFDFAGKTDRAHRVSWILHNGPIPSGVCVLHKCDTPECTNPRHLFLGTRADNNADRANKLRGPRGVTHYCAKLKDADIPRIFKMWRDGKQQREIAKEFGVTQRAAAQVLHRISWRHVKIETQRRLINVNS